MRALIERRMRQGARGKWSFGFDEKNGEIDIVQIIHFTLVAEVKTWIIIMVRNGRDFCVLLPRPRPSSIQPPWMTPGHT